VTHLSPASCFFSELLLKVLKGSLGSLEFWRVLEEEALGGAALLRTSGKIFQTGQSGNLFLVRLGWLIALERGRAVAFEGFAEDVWQDISDWSIWEFILGATGMAYCAGTREGPAALALLRTSGKIFRTGQSGNYSWCDWDALLRWNEGRP